MAPVAKALGRGVLPTDGPRVGCNERRVPSAYHGTPWRCRVMTEHGTEMSVLGFVSKSAPGWACSKLRFRQYPAFGQGAPGWEVSGHWPGRPCPSHPKPTEPKHHSIDEITDLPTDGPCSCRLVIVEFC